MARRQFSVSVVTPDGPAYEGDAEMIIVPGAAGEIGVLARHAPLIATLKAGATRIHLGGGADVLEYATGPGLRMVISGACRARTPSSPSAPVAIMNSTSPSKRLRSTLTTRSGYFTVAS